jgi:hypothetical protein
VHSLAYFQGSFREKQDYAFTAKSSVWRRVVLDEAFDIFLPPSSRKFLPTGYNPNVSTFYIDPIESFIKSY